MKTSVDAAKGQAGAELPQGNDGDLAMGYAAGKEGTGGYMYHLLARPESKIKSGK